MWRNVPARRAALPAQALKSRAATAHKNPLANCDDAMSGCCTGQLPELIKAEKREHSGNNDTKNHQHNPRDPQDVSERILVVIR